MGLSPTRGSSFFLGKVTALGVLCCLFDLACFFLPSFSSLPSHLSLYTCRTTNIDTPPPRPPLHTNFIYKLYMSVQSSWQRLLNFPIWPPRLLYFPSGVSVQYCCYKNYMFNNETYRKKEGRSKQGQTNNKAKQHSTHVFSDPGSRCISFRGCLPSR